MPGQYGGLLDPENGRMENISLKTRSKSWTAPRTWGLHFLSPSFLNFRAPSPAKKDMRRTAWLDGLRGFAAFLVYWHHHHLWAHDDSILENAFGYDDKRYFAQLPIIRTFFSGGHLAVAVFFVISGYVLSVKSLSQIQKGEHVGAADTVGSALFRRWLRLYIPVIATSFLWMTQWHTTRFWTALYPKPKPTYGEELWNWYATFKNYSFVFLTGNVYEFPLQYHIHAWSIPFEMKGSIIVYTVISALSRCTRNARLWCELGLIYYFMYIVDGWYGALFVAGVLLCDLDLLGLVDQMPRFFSIFEGFKELIFFNLFIAGLYLGGVPSHDGSPEALEQSPGWVWLSYLKPQAVFDPKWFYVSWAGVFIVASAPRLPWLKSFFEGRFCQYLARISYALYLVHGPVLFSIGARLYSATGFANLECAENIPQWVDAFPLSKNGPLGFELAFWVPQIILLPITLYAAELVTKIFDEQSVKISTWLYQRTLDAPPAKSSSS